MIQFESIILNFAKRKQRSKRRIPPQVTDIFLLENSATQPRTVALRPCEAPSIRFSPSSACDIRISKKISRVFCEFFSQKIVFAKSSPHCICISLHFPFLESSVLRTEALQRAGNAVSAILKIDSHLVQ